jgi:2-polyprenyl-3-methyl-5-hydroxy-6-metoxy-1,4-benzoquinol methylase
MSTLTNCPVCNSSSHNEIFKNGRDFILRCIKCGFAWRKSYPSFSEASNLYQKESYFDERGMGKFYKDQLLKFGFVKKHVHKKAKILDFGCGMGEFLRICKKRGLKSVGYDVSTYVAREVSKKYKVPIFSARLSKNVFKKEEFDAIVMFGVIEHVPEFVRILQCFNYWLKKDGFLFITTPNIDNWDARLFGKYWYGFERRVSEHINYFSPTSIKKVLEESNFCTEKILPWGFVRSFNFLMTKVSSGKINTVPFVGKKSIFFPMIDMMVVAQKREN